MMESLPPRGSARRRTVLGFWIAFTVFLVAMIIWAAATDGMAAPWLAVLGGGTALLGIWRWILARRRGDTH